LKKAFLPMFLFRKKAFKELLTLVILVLTKMLNKFIRIKETFANLLKEAKGNRSINQYANEVDISAAHISRLLRSLVDSLPSPDTISKLAKGAYNGVTYSELMLAAGLLMITQKLRIKDNKQQKRKRSFPKLFCQIYILVILSEI